MRLDPPDHISYSYLHLLACPYSAFLRYEAAIKSDSSGYLVLGTSLHNVLEYAHKEQDFDLKSWVRMFKEQYNGLIVEEDVVINYPQLKKLEADGVDILEVYNGQVQSGKITKRPVDVEKEFSIPFLGTKIVGRIDKVEEGTVIDYKSGSFKPDAWSLRHNIQLTVYYWAHYEIYGFYPKILRWHHLRTGEFLDTERTIDDIDQVKRMIDNALKMRENGIFFRVYNDSVCGNGTGRGIQCDYRGKICDSAEIEDQALRRLGFRS